MPNLPESKTPQPRSFWTTVPGVVTAIAGFITALATLLVSLHTINVDKRGNPTPTTAPTQFAALDERFDSPDSGWYVGTETETEAAYVAGEYRLALYAEQISVWGSPAIENSFTDFAIEVDARAMEGPVDNSFGLLVRYQADDQSFYAFQISSDGYYSVDMLQAGAWVALVDWTAAESIHQGLGAINRLRVVCDRSRFRFYANGSLLTEILDNTYAAGNVGLIASSVGGAGVVVHFDNLRVSPIDVP